MRPATKRSIAIRACRKRCATSRPPLPTPGATFVRGGLHDPMPTLRPRVQSNAAGSLAANDRFGNGKAARRAPSPLRRINMETAQIDAVAAQETMYPESRVKPEARSGEGVVVTYLSVAP